MELSQGFRCRIQFQDKDESLPGLKLVQEPSDQWVAKCSQDVSFLVRLGPSFAPQGDELGCTGHLVSFMLNPFHETEHTPGGEEGEREPIVGTMLRVPWEELETGAGEEAIPPNLFLNLVEGMQFSPIDLLFGI